MLRRFNPTRFSVRALAGQRGLHIPAGGRYLNIGDVRLPVASMHAQPERVPNVLSDGCKQFFPMTMETRAALRWMAQKELLGQDMCLIGEPGPLRRWLALTYCHYAKREVQIQFLSRDTTDADIKQRKEITNGTLSYAHQAAVSAALNGQVLILEGLERAERNVLPIINNLLENREMHLDDGRSIIHPQRYDALLRTSGKQNLDHLGLLRCSENFRVIALTVPVPKYPGNPLDPPLRSRFQSFYLHAQSDPTDGLLATDSEKVGATIASLRASLKTCDAGGSDSDRKLNVPQLGSYEAVTLLQMCKRFPKEPLAALLPLVFPWELTCLQGSKIDLQDRAARVANVLKRFHALSPVAELHNTSVRHPSNSSALADLHPSVMTQCTIDSTIPSEASNSAPRQATATFLTGEKITVAVGQHFPGASPDATLTTGPTPFPSSSHVVLTPYFQSVLTEMVLSHASGRHMLLVGDAGCGKSSMMHRFADTFGYDTEVMHMFSDMSTRDLLQRRVTCPSTGDTRWELSPLMAAAKYGRLAVLDGIDNMPPGMLVVLQELLVDGNITLVDGSVFKSHESYEMLKAAEGVSDADLAERGVYAVHPSFRVVATAKPPTPSGSGTAGKSSSASQPWLNAELPTMFNVVAFRHLPREDALQLLLQQASGSSTASSRGTAVAERLLDVQLALKQLQATDSKTPQLTLRHLVHIVSFVTHQQPDALSEALESALLLPLVASVTRMQLRRLMAEVGIPPVQQRNDDAAAAPKDPSSCGRGAAAALSSWLGGDKQGQGPPSAGGVAFRSKPTGGVDVVVASRRDGTERVVFSSTRIYTPSEQALIPHVHHFVPNHQQDAVLAWIGSHLACASRLLLVGTQGVGKNKVADYFLMQAGLPRHYVQLHRDTTVGSLTTTPTVIGGKVVWEDSPLVKAVKNGHVLVVDEVDKAPVEVVQVLKGLVEDKEMFLSDGRRIVSRTAMQRYRAAERSNLIVLHEDFRIVVLANPPGYPFHGNDFYRVCGDLFQTYVLQNPDMASQIKLLTTLAPNVPEVIIHQLVRVFAKLTKHCEEGALTYPFSLRELIAVVKHLRAFPQDGMYQALNNVFNFDLMDDNTMHHVRRILHETLRKDELTRLKSTIAPSIPLDAERNVVANASTLFDGPHHMLPCSVRNLIDDFPYLSVQAVPSDYVRVVAATPQELQAVVPQTLSEVRVTCKLPFLEASRNAKVLQTCVTDQQLLFVLFTDDALAKRNCVCVATMVVPGHDAGLVTKQSRLSHDSFILADIPLHAFQTSRTSPSDLRMYPMEPIMAMTFHAPTQYDGVGSCVALVDLSSSRLMFHDPLRLAGYSLAMEEVDESGGDEGSGHLIEGVPREHPPTATTNISVLSLVGPDAVSLTDRTVTVDAECDVVACCGRGSNLVHVVPQAATFGAECLTITLPSPVETLRFFSPLLAHVVFANGSNNSGGRRHAILKVSSPRSAGRGTSALRYLSGDALRALGLDGADGASAVFGGLKPMSHGGHDATFATSTIDDTDVDGAVVASNNGSGFAVIDRGGAVDRFVLPRQAKPTRAPTAAVVMDTKRGHLIGSNHLFDTTTSTARTLPSQVSSASAVGVSNASSLLAAIGPDHTVSTVERDYARLTKEMESWNSLMDGRAGGLGAPPTPQELDMWYSKPKKAPSGSLKHGKEDPDNTPHVGGNQWAGGTGGTDTAGLGGLVGPYRLDKGHTVHQVSPEEKKKVPQHIVDEARKMGKEALAKRLKEIGMSAEEHKMYQDLLLQVQGPVAQLQNMLSGLKAQEGERVWARHQSDGVWDDAKVVEGITGERNIYKRRMESQDSDALRHKKRKRLLFVLDVSASMYRFNGMDQRLNRLVESATMVMEAFIGQEDKIDYAMVGHNGDSDSLPLVEFGRPPANKKERMEICLKMIAYAQYCWSGDNTVNAMRKAVATVTAEDADSYFVFVISDANLAQYGISPTELARIIRSDDRVHMYCIFIASFGQQSSNLQRHLPAGHGFECFDTRQLPLVMSQIFVSTNLLGGL